MVGTIHVQVRHMGLAESFIAVTCSIQILDVCSLLDYLE